MNHKLRDYQIDAVERITDRHRIILGDEQGLGKTVTALTAIKRLVGDSGGVLVLGPKVALGTWKDEVRKWLNEDAMIYCGDDPPHVRKELWHRYQEEKPFLLVATYAMIEEIANQQAGWQAVICDEYHKAGLMNHKSQTYRKFKRLRYRFFIPVSGTPVRKGPQDLFAPLSLIDPYRFKSYWTFVNKHCIRIDDTFGYTIEARPKSPREFAEMLKPYLIRRTKKAVLKDLPPKTRQPLHLTMTPKQRRMYEDLAYHNMLHISDTRTIVCPNEAVKIIRLRQLLVSPQILGLKEKGAALEALPELIADSFDAKRPVAIFTPFKPGVECIERTIKEAKLTQKVYKIHGDMKIPARETANAFQQEEDHRKVIVYTTTSGMSWDAYSASNAFVIGAEWTALDNVQAEDRIHRLGQQECVNIYYFIHDGTIDEAVMLRLDERQMASNWVLRTEDMLRLVEQQRQQGTIRK